MPLYVKDLCLDPPLALAPMVGLSHSALRSLLVGLGGVGLLFTEMLSAKRLPSENERLSPFLVKNDCEQPLFYQIYASAATELEPAIEKLEQLGAHGIDLNLGCPAPNIRRSGAGTDLLAEPRNACRVLSRLRGTTARPLSVKIRIGKEPDPVGLRDTCLMLADTGIDLITVHARLEREKFCRRPRWEMLAPAAAAIDIPLFANGGIFSIADARCCLERSGAAGLMIGRAAARSPWLFREIARTLYKKEFRPVQRSPEEIYFDFIDLLKERFVPERQLGRLKQFTHYYGEGLAFGHHLMSAVQGSTSMDEAAERALGFFGGET